MYLKEAILVRFGKFENRSIPFEKNLQLFYGANETGKSTVQLFLKVMLYGISGTKKDERGMKERERVIPWNQKSAEGILRLDVDGRSLEIHRKFGKTASGDRTKVLDAHTGQEVLDYDNKQLGEQLCGVPETVFEKTFWLRQSGAFMGGADQELSARLLNLLETGEEEFSADTVLQELEREKRAVKAKDKRSAQGTLDRLWAEREEKIRERYQLISGMHQREAEQRRFSSEKERLEKAEQQLEKLKELDKRKKQLLLMKEKQKKWEQAEHILALAKQAESRAVYQDFQALSEAEANRAESLEKNLETLDQSERIEYDKKKAEDEMLRQKADEQKSGLFVVFGIAFLLLALVLAVWRPALWGIWAAVSCGATGFGTAVFGILRMQKAKNRTENVQKQYQQLSKSEEEHRRQVEKVRAELTAILEKYSCRNAKELQDGYLRCRQAHMEAESYRKTYASMLENEDVEALGAQQQEICAALEQGADLLRQDIEEEIQEFQNIRMDAVAKMKEAEGKLSYVFRDNRSPADVETEIMQIDQDIAEQEKKLKAIEMAASTFAAVYQRRKSDFTPLVNEKVDQYMCSLTCGKYQDVRVSEEYQMQIAPEGNQLYAAEYLSRGTYEQIYFALRLALGALIGNGTEPLFLDDFLMSYDDERAESALKLLYSLGKKRQILFFTCHLRDVEHAEKLGIKISHLEEERENVC